MAQEPPIIDYATPKVEAATTTLEKMMQWRSRAAVCFGIAIIFFVGGICLVANLNGMTIQGALVISGFWISLAASLVCSVVTLASVGKIAKAEVNAGYAARQVILAILLCPLFLLGVFLVPVLVQSDLNKWRRVEERQRLESEIAAIASGKGSLISYPESPPPQT